MRTHRGALPAHLGIVLAAGLLPGAAPADAPAGPDLIEVFARTLVVGPHGTRTAARDRALLAPDKTGLLRVDVDLAGGESVSLELKVRYAPEPERDDEGPAVVVLGIDSTARAQPSGGVVLRSGGGALSLPGSLLHEAFVSTSSGERVVINLEAAPWIDPGPSPLPAPVTDLTPVSYRISIYRKTTSGLDFLGMPQLHSLVGRSVSYGFGFALGARGSEAATGESLELTIHGVELRDGNLTGKMTLEGDLRGQPVRTSRGWSLRSGQQETLSFSFGTIGGEAREGVVVLEAVF